MIPVTLTSVIVLFSIAGILWLAELVHKSRKR